MNSDTNNAAPRTTYQVAYELGGRGAVRDTLPDAVRAMHHAQYAQEHTDVQGIGLVAIDYAADGSDPWGVERPLAMDEMVEMYEMAS
jgi:hypothetical protein